MPPPAEIVPPPAVNVPPPAVNVPPPADQIDQNYEFPFVYCFFKLFSFFFPVFSRLLNLSFYSNWQPSVAIKYGVRFPIFLFSPWVHIPLFPLFFVHFSLKKIQLCGVVSLR